MLRSRKYGADMRATIGRIELIPNRVNIVPGRAVSTVDLRNPEDEAMTRAERDLAAFLESLAVEMGVSIESRQTARTPRIRFSEEVQSVIASHMDAKKLKHTRILSGAGHDAQEFAAVCPTAMIFVPGEYEGISHNPREWSTKEACERGVSVLAETILSLAR
jgi:N-carbamoyl-L-amino-acid hydrolase